MGAPKELIVVVIAAVAILGAAMVAAPVRQSVKRAPEPKTLGPSEGWQYYASVAGKAEQVGPVYPTFGISAVDSFVKTIQEGRVDKVKQPGMPGRLWRQEVSDSGLGGVVVLIP